MDKAKKVFMNGKYVDWKNANVHILTHGLHYGTGIFEGTILGPLFNENPANY